MFSNPDYYYIFVEFLVFFSGPYMHLGGPQGPNYFCGIFSFFFSGPYMHLGGPQGPNYFCGIFSIFFSGPYGHLGGPQGPKYFCGFFSIFSGPYGLLGGPVAGGSHVPEPRPKSIIYLIFYNGNRPCRPQNRILREHLGGVSGCRQRDHTRTAKIFWGNF